ncbi:MAG: HAMP domain-containing sensor histidine kinase [Acidobacteriota bacterium]
MATAPYRPSRIVATFILSLGFTLSLLVLWVVYVTRSASKINELALRGGLNQEHFHWWLMGLGCLFLSGVICGLAVQLAQALSERRYALKQQEFVSNITHELKSPLAAIRLHAETLLGDEGIDSNQRRDFLGHILRQSERMGALVDNVLEASRLQARKHRPQHAIDLRSFAAAYLPLAQERLKVENVELQWLIDTEAKVWADEHSLERVLDNLIDNAARFSSPGGEVRVSVGSPSQGSEEIVQIAVEDDGVGIPKGELERIFERFYQLGDVDRKAGSGLGLSIVASLVREMNGQVRAVPREAGQGARFEVDLPIDGE